MRLQGQEFGAAQTFRQALVPGENHAEELARVEVLAGQDSEFAKDAVDDLLCLVENEDRAAARRRDVLGPPGSDGLEAAEAIVGLEGHAEEVADLAIEVRDA